MKPVSFQKALKALQERKKILVRYHSNNINIDEIWEWGKNIKSETELKVDLLLNGEFFILE